MMNTRTVALFLSLCAIFDKNYVYGAPDNTQNVAEGTASLKEIELTNSGDGITGK